MATPAGQNAGTSQGTLEGFQMIFGNGPITESKLRWFLGGAFVFLVGMVLLFAAMGDGKGKKTDDTSKQTRTDKK